MYCASENSVNLSHVCVFCLCICMFDICVCVCV